MTTDDTARSTDGDGRSFSRRQLLQGASTGLAATTLAGCVSSLPGAGGGSEPFTVGGLWALSQGWGTWGKMQKQHVEYAVKQINDDGGIDGRDVEFVLEDTQIDPKTTTEKARKLVQQDNVDVLVGPNASSSRAAMSQVSEQEQVPHLYPVYYEGIEAPDYCNEWLFKFSGVPYGSIKPIAPWALDNFGSKVFLIGADYVWPHATNKQVKKFVGENGGEIVGETYVALGTSDYSSILPRIKQADPDIIWSTQTATEAVPFQQQAYNQGLREDWQEIHMSITPLGLKDKNPDPFNGIYEPHVYYPSDQNEENQALISGLQDEYGDETIFDTIGGVYYSCVRALPTAVENGGGTSNEAIKSGFEELNGYSSPMGPLTMANDHQTKLTYKLAEIQIEPDVPYWQYHKVRQRFGPIAPPDQCDAI